MTAGRTYGREMLALAGVFALLVLPLLLLESRLAQPRALAQAQAVTAANARAVFGPEALADDAAATVARFRYVPVRAEGYGGRIDAMLAIDARGCLRGVAVLGHRESPGYGAPLLTRQALADRNGWLAGLLDRCAGTPATLATDGTTGATITANALARAVRGGLPAPTARAP